MIEKYHAVKNYYKRYSMNKIIFKSFHCCSVKWESLIWKFKTNGSIDGNGDGKFKVLHINKMNDAENMRKYIALYKQE